MFFDSQSSNPYLVFGCPKHAHKGWACPTNVNIYNEFLAAQNQLQIRKLLPNFDSLQQYQTIDYDVFQNMIKHTQNLHTIQNLKKGLKHLVSENLTQK